MAVAVAEESLLAAAAEADGGAASFVASETQVLPLGEDALQQALLHAMRARRERWRSVLLEASVELGRFLTKLVSCSCRGALEGLAALLVRVADVLPSTSAKEVLVSPLLELQTALGRCVADDGCERPAGAE